MVRRSARLLNDGSGGIGTIRSTRNTVGTVGAVGAVGAVGDVGDVGTVGTVGTANAASASPSGSSTPAKRKSPSSDPASPSSSPAKRVRPPPFSRKSSGSISRNRTTGKLAIPATTLPLLPDALAPNLLLLFVGLNPGVQTSLQGHAYAHPSNLFWRLLHSSGITPDRRLPPSEDQTMPALYSCGLTNIVGRPTRSGADLVKGEMEAGVSVLEAKVRRWRPEAVCIVGKGIWEAICKVRGKSMKGFEYGWQGESENMGIVRAGSRLLEEEEVAEGVTGGPWKGARVFVATSTSGLAATLSLAEKQSIWKVLGDWMQQRRVERKATEQRRHR